MLPLIRNWRGSREEEAAGEEDVAVERAVRRSGGQTTREARAARWGVSRELSAQIAEAVVAADAKVVVVKASAW